MDKRSCTNCGKTFDFDREGLQSSMTGFVFCSAACAKAITAKAGRKHAIHNRANMIVETDAAANELAGHCIASGGRSSLKTTRGGLLMANKLHRQVFFYEVTSADLRQLADCLAKREADAEAGHRRLGRGFERGTKEHSGRRSFDKKT